MGSVLGDAVRVGRRFDGVRSGLAGDECRPGLATDNADFVRMMPTDVRAQVEPKADGLEAAIDTANRRPRCIRKRTRQQSALHGNAQATRGSTARMTGDRATRPSDTPFPPRSPGGGAPGAPSLELAIVGGMVTSAASTPGVQ